MSWQYAVMISSKPTKFISLKNINDFSIYEKNLENWPLIKEHFSETIKIWIANHKNPLVILVIQGLLENDARWFEKLLQEFKSRLREETFREFIKEFKNNPKFQYESSKELYSLLGEFIASEKVLETCSEIKKFKKLVTGSVIIK